MNLVLFIEGTQIKKKKPSSFYQLGCQIFSLIPDILTHSLWYTPKKFLCKQVFNTIVYTNLLKLRFFSHKIGILPSLLNLGPRRNHRALVHPRQPLQWQTPQTTSFVFSFTSFEFRHSKTLLWICLPRRALTLNIQ